jgi:putative nucleotidyltransferase with HDIG domain
VSLLVLDKDKSILKVAASRGLPDEVSHLSIPVAGSIAEHTLSEEDLLVVDDIADRPDLAGMSQGRYDSNAFAAVRVPLRARGEGLGVLAVTERHNGNEFTARDRKLLEGLSAMGASALLNCQLHSAVNRQMLSTIEALASAVDAKDAYTHNHSARVAEMCLATAKALGVTDRKSCRDIELAGLLHDIGKIGIPDAILQKPGRLTPDEYRLIKSHVTTGANIVNKVEGLDEVAEAILRHHERHDGLGYPGGLAGDAIPLASKLIAIVDTYDSLTTDRPYRKSLGVEHAVTELRRCTGTQFDPAVVDVFIESVVR